MHKNGGTFGKKIMGLKVIKSKGNPYLNLPDVLMREVLGKPLSVGIGFIGIIFIFFNDEKKCFHDFIAKTNVIKND